MKLLNKRIIDAPGKMPVGLMRTFFELAMQQTGLLTPEEMQIVNVSGQFSHYYRRPVDLAWIGFALGLRCQERLDDHFRTVQPPEGFEILKSGRIIAGDLFFVDGSGWHAVPAIASGEEIIGTIVARPIKPQYPAK